MSASFFPTISSFPSSSSPSASLVSLGCFNGIHNIKLIANEVLSQDEISYWRFKATSELSVACLGVVGSRSVSSDRFSPTAELQDTLDSFFWVPSKYDNYITNSGSLLYLKKFSNNYRLQGSTFYFRYDPSKRILSMKSNNSVLARGGVYQYKLNWPGINNGIWPIGASIDEVKEPLHYEKGFESDW